MANPFTWMADRYWDRRIDRSRIVADYPPSTRRWVLGATLREQRSHAKLIGLTKPKIRRFPLIP